MRVFDNQIVVAHSQDGASKGYRLLRPGRAHCLHLPGGKSRFKTKYFRTLRVLGITKSVFFEWPEIEEVGIEDQEWKGHAQQCRRQPDLSLVTRRSRR